MIDPPEHPLQMPVRAAWLELRLHMTTEIRLGEHQASFVMLLAHDTLVPVKAGSCKEILVLQVRQCYVDVLPFTRAFLEAQLAVPGLTG